MMEQKGNTPSLASLFKIIKVIRRTLEFISPVQHRFSTTQCIVAGAFFDLKYKGHELVTAKMINDVTGMPQSSVYRSINRLIEVGIVDKGDDVGSYKIIIDYPKEIIKYLTYGEEAVVRKTMENEPTIGEIELKEFIAKTIREEMKNISATISPPLKRPKEKVLNSETSNDTLLDDLEDINALLDEEAEGKGIKKRKTSSLLDSLSGVFQ